MLKAYTGDQNPFQWILQASRFPSLLRNLSRECPRGTVAPVSLPLSFLLAVKCQVIQMSGAAYPMMHQWDPHHLRITDQVETTIQHGWGWRLKTWILGLWSQNCTLLLPHIHSRRLNIRSPQPIHQLSQLQADPLTTASGSWYSWVLSSFRVRSQEGNPVYRNLWAAFWICSRCHKYSPASQFGSYHWNWQSRCSRES